MTANGSHEPSHRAHQTAAQLAREPAAFPATTLATPLESAFPDWRERLNRNFSRRADGRWEPLTRVHAGAGIQAIEAIGSEERLRRGLLRLFELT